MAKPTTIRSKKSFSATTIAVSVLLVLSLAVGTYFFVQYTKVNNKYQAFPEVQNKETIARVAKLIDLPKDETPDIYAVEDKEKVTQTSNRKEFFAKASNGDKVLVYNKANQAILFRPSDNRIINNDKADKLVVIPVAVIAPSEQQETTANNLQKQFGTIQITSKSAPKTEILTSFVVDAIGSEASKGVAKELANSLGLTVGQLPEGETKPEGQNLIVVIAKPALQ